MRPIVLWALEPGTARRQLGVIAELDEAGVDAVVLSPNDLTAPDSLMVAAAASRRAPHIGLVATLSPWQQPPFLTARALGTLDALTRGRAGWLVEPGSPAFTASDDTARWNPAQATDATELDSALADYLQATRALGDSWEADALIADVAHGQYVDPSKVHVTHHRGDYYSSRGPLNMPRPPQGRPVVVARFALTGERPAAECAAADVIIVESETQIDAARRLCETVLLELSGVAATAPPATAADGYVFSGVADAQLHGHLVHVTLPSLVAQPPSAASAASPALLRDRLRLPPEAFAWRAGRRHTGLSAREGAAA
jgi:alkanesulfonate monooxygenase SsuD/methylene tetrahydromethanopterin reductase-like flavin-dependent oxidoreductase (luciferase family)